jgi:hypothetical protein
MRARFLSADNGGLTIHGLFMTIVMLMVGGLAVDISQLMAARSQLQVAADLTAHAALYNRDTMTPENAKIAALEAAEASMPTGRYGVVLTADDIEFGSYDPDTLVFTASATSRTGVRVLTSRLASKANPVSAMLLRFAGFTQFDLRTRAIFTTFRPACFHEGFVADGVVDIQSNNSYFDGFCIHSNDHVSVNSNNYWEPGTVVSMPSIADLDLPQSGFETNLGLQQALREGYYHMRLINKLPRIIANLTSWGNEWQPDYITNATTLTLTGNSAEPANFISGRFHSKTCASTGSKFTISAGTYTNVVFVTNCKIEFANGAILVDSIFATTNTSSRSIDGPQGVQLGLDDNCATGGGAQLLTLGGMNFAANLAMFGGQLVAAGDIEFSARADGLEGASMIAGGLISGTSNMSMALCGNGMEDNIEANYFRLGM